MQRRVFLTGALAGLPLLAACAPTPYTNPIGREARAALRFSDIVVSTSGAAFESARAADYATRLGPELRAALRREFADRMDPAGVPMFAEIQRLNVATGTGTAFGRDQSRMSGAVRVLDLQGQVLGSYGIAVVAGAARESRLGALAAASLSSAERFYRALIDDFAATARTEILGTELPGARLLRRTTAG